MSDHFFSRWSRRKQGIDHRGVTEAEPLAPASGAVVAAAPSGSGAAKGVFAAGSVPAAAPRAGGPESEPATPPDRPLPTMADVQGLTPSSDFQDFMRQGVPGEVRNAAMKKLFTDPHFNVMDGLDIYIGDYNTPDPLPAGMLEKMVGAQLLNLFPPQAAELRSDQTDEALSAAPPPPEQSLPQDNKVADTTPVVAQTPPADTSVSLTPLSSLSLASSSPPPLDSSFPPLPPLATPLAPSWDPPKHDHPDLQLQPNHAPASPNPGQSTG